MNIVILGGGASGMTAAISAALSNPKNKITIIEHSDRVGKKILATGNGKCNLTNENMKVEYFRCDDSKCVKTVLDNFGYSDTIKFFSDLGIMFKVRDGYVYPASGQASSVLDVLRLKCEELGIEIWTDKNIKKIIVNDGYMLDDIKADRLIIATGSKASNLPCADESGYNLVKKLGYKINKPLPALTGLKCKENFCKSMAGVRTEGNIKLYIDDNFVAEDVGEIQLTDYGISGIPVFQVSRFASKALNQGSKVRAEIDFMPFVTENELKRIFDNKFVMCPKKTLDEQMIGVLNKKLSSVIIKISGNRVDKLLHNIKHFEFNITATNNFDQAQVCTGGIDIFQIDFTTMESKLHKGLYFAGEIIDVDAICGGYNLQWAWATGYIAGRNAS